MADKKNNTPSLPPGFVVDEPLPAGFVEDTPALPPGFQVDGQAPTSEPEPHSLGKDILAGTVEGLKGQIPNMVNRAVQGGETKYVSFKGVKIPTDNPIANKVQEWLGLGNLNGKTAEADKPQTLPGKATEFVALAADPAMWAFGSWVGGLKSLNSAVRAEKYIKLATQGRRLGALNEPFYQMGGYLVREGAERKLLPSVASKVSQYLSTYSREAAIRGAIEGGAGAFAQEGLDQILNEGTFQPGDLALRTLGGSAFGGALGGLIGRWSAGKLAKGAKNAFEDSANNFTTGVHTHLERVAAHKAANEYDEAAARVTQELELGHRPLSSSEKLDLQRQLEASAAKLGNIERSVARAKNPLVAHAPLARPESTAIKGLTSLMDDTFLAGSEPGTIMQEWLGRRSQILADLKDKLNDVTKVDEYLEELSMLKQVDEKITANLSARGVKEARDLTIKSVGEIGELERGAARLVKEAEEMLPRAQREILAQADSLSSGVRKLTAEEADELVQYRQSMRSLAQARRDSVNPIKRLQQDLKPGELDLQSKIAELNDGLDKVIASTEKAGRKDVAAHLRANKEKMIARAIVEASANSRRVRMPNGTWKEIPLKQEKILKGGFMEGALNNTTLFSKVDTKLKYTNLVEVITRLGEAEMERDFLHNRMMSAILPIKEALRKVNPAVADDFGTYFQHVETDPLTGAIVWNATPDGALVTALPPDPETMQLLFKARQVFDSFGSEVGAVHRRAYVPHYNRDVMIPKASSSFEKAVIDKPSLHRQENAFDPLVHKTRLEDIVDDYVSDAAQYLAFNKHVPAVHREILKLSVGGHVDEAAKFAKVAARSMGVRTKEDLTRLLNDSVVDDLEKIGGVIADISPEVHGEFWRFAHRQLYGAKVFLNPLTQILQRLQPEMVGAAEVRLHNIVAARAGQVTEGTKRAWENAKNRALVSDPRKFLDGSGISEGNFTNMGYKVADAISEGVTWIPRKIFSQAETRNREIVFKAAHHQFTKAMRDGITNLTDNAAVGDEAAKALDGILGMMNGGQRKAILRVFHETAAREGLEKAIEKTAIEYSLMRTLRANFMMTMADKPEFFAQGLGSYIPFTTWSRNAFAQMAGDFENGVTGEALANTGRRIVLPALAGLLAARMSGSEPFPMIGKSVPLASVVGVGTGDVAPSIFGTAEAFVRQGPAAGALKALDYTVPGTLWNKYRDVRDSSDKSRTKLQGFLGLNPNKLSLEEQARAQLKKFQSGIE